MRFITASELISKLTHLPANHQIGWDYTGDASASDIAIVGINPETGAEAEVAKIAMTHAILHIRDSQNESTRKAAP